MAYKCGMIVVGGIKTGVNMSDALYSWDSLTDTWSQIGTYPNLVATPVCGLVGDELICATGGEWSDQKEAYFGKFSIV